MIKKATPMKLEKCTIEREIFGRDAGKLTGRATFSSPNTTVLINITEEHAQKILDLCADALLKTAHEMAEITRGDIIEALETEKPLSLT